MERHPNELWLFLDCESSSHKKTRALAKSITRHVNEFSLSHNKLSKLRWAEILLMLNLRPKDLLNKSNKKYQEMIAGHDFDEDSWLEILRENPCMIKAPIAILNNKAVLCINPKDIYKLLPDHKIHPVID
jgi:arsenate reductase